MPALHLDRQHASRVFRGILLLIAASILLAPIGAAASPSQLGVSWDYKLLGKLNSSTDPATGLTIVIMGSGSFDTSKGTIGGGGSYTIVNSSGSVVGSGQWQAEEPFGFSAMGPGHSPGEGGRLELWATFPNGTGTGILQEPARVVIQCSMWGETAGPPGYPWLPDFVEVGPYTAHKTGAVMFNLNQ